MRTLVLNIGEFFTGDIAAPMALALAFLLFGCSSQQPNVGDANLDATTDRNAVSPSSGIDALSDPWESKGIPPNDEAGCFELDRALIIPVPQDQRAEAIARLESVPALRLDDADAARFLHIVQTQPRQGLVTNFVDKAIANLREQKRKELDERVGSWGPMEEERLTKLVALRDSPHLLDLKPYLVRAVAKNEFTGAFWVTSCDDAVFVMHGSLGHAIPQSQRLPIILFLDHLPKHVYISWAMAE
jgi:hypothetical protein